MRFSGYKSDKGGVSKNSELLIEFGGAKGCLIGDAEIIGRFWVLCMGFPKKKTSENQKLGLQAR